MPAPFKTSSANLPRGWLAARRAESGRAWSDFYMEVLAARFEIKAPKGHACAGCGRACVDRQHRPRPTRAGPAVTAQSRQTSAPNLDHLLLSALRVAPVRDARRSPPPNLAAMGIRLAAEEMSAA